MYIFIDSNVYFENYFLDSANFQLLINFLNNTNGYLLISEIVRAEVQNHQETKSKEAFENLKKAIKNYNQLHTEKCDARIDIINNDYDFETVLVEKINNARFIPFNKVEHSVVVNRAVKKIRPFKEQDKGYRDTMIWLSLLIYLKANNIDELVFINTNSTDFYKSNSTGFLDELLEDIRVNDVKTIFNNFISLPAFLQAMVKSEEHQVDYERIQQDYLDVAERDLQVEISDYLNGISSVDFLALIQEHNPSFPELPVSSSHYFEIVEGVEDPLLLNCKKIDDDQLYINYKFNFRICELSFSIDNFYLLGNPMWMNNYFDMEEYPTGMKLTAYYRIDLEVSFNFILSKRAIDGLSIDVFKIRNNGYYRFKPSDNDFWKIDGHS
jgi:hypothetical protein